MTRTLYIAALDPNSGKSVVALGVMELLIGRAGRVGFFRPLIRDLSTPDPLVQLIFDRYGIEEDPTMSYGVTYEELRRATSDGAIDQLIGRVVERFRVVEKHYDAMVCVGSDFGDVTAATEFALNLRLADNLGAAVLAVVSGERKTPSDVVAAIQVAEDSLVSAGNAVVAVLANRVSEGDVDEIRAALRERTTLPAYVVPFDPVLVEPTVRDIAEALGARLLFGDESALERDVHGSIVGAATLPTVLGFLRDGVLVIVPGDRDDIVLGALATSASAAAPVVSALLLTAGLQPDPRITRVVERLAPQTPVLSVDADTFSTAQAVGRVSGRVLSGGTRKVEAALAGFESSVDVDELMRRIELTRPTRVTPLMFEYDLVERARSDSRRIVLPEGSDDRVLRAADIIRRRGVANITLLGALASIREREAALGLDLAGVDIIDPLAPESADLRERLAESYAAARAHKGVTLTVARDVVTDVSYFGTLMVHEGLADGMVSGAAHTTAHTIRPSLEVIGTVPGVRTVSSVFFMCLADRVLVYGDCAIVPDPDAEQLADIAVSSASTAKQFGVEPLVAMLSYSTGESGSGADVEKVREARRLVHERRPDLAVEGPIQYDAAVDASVGQVKLPGSEVAGRATVFVFPDLNTGNNTYKAVQRSAGAVAVGPVLQGLRRPVNDLSRGCTIPDIVNTVAITAIQAQAVPSPS
ncbi:MAG TPA: phosphate acetyltransferase [Acidothermales bacterium]